MKKISVLIPCYNEEDNVREICSALKKMFAESLPLYDYEIVFIDNKSQDRTREYLEQLCSNDSRVKAIFNARNFGQNNSPYYGILQTTGDCTIAMSCDFQDPPEMIPKFVNEWEKGHAIVCAIKSTSKENKIFRFFRTCYYRTFSKMSDIEPIEHFTGFGLYDRKFVEIMRTIDDPIPFMRGIVAEYGFNMKKIDFEQPKRRAGKTHNNWFTLYDIAMRSFTSYTRMGLRALSIVGFFMSGVSFLLAIVYLIYKLIYWDTFVAGMTPILLAVLILGSIQLSFIGLLGEYILSINKRVMHRPLVIEEKRLNFTKEE